MVPDLRSSTTLGLGYVVSIPNTFIGFSTMLLTPKVLGGAGLYADVKFSHSSPKDDEFYVEGESVESAEAYGDFFLKGESEWLSVNLALVYAVTRELGLYAGGGYGRKRRYREYYDTTLNRGFEGFYWVYDEADSGNRVNALGGLLIRAATNFVIQIGGETRPAGATVGAMFTLPF
jgi:hypothetical protein